MNDIIRKIEEAIETISDIRINLSADGNSLFSVLTPAEYSVNGSCIEITDICDNSYVINCEEVKYDDLCDFFIIRSGESEVVMEFKPCF